jgi:Xaa-Pro aminopeptidase
MKRISRAAFLLSVLLSSVSVLTQTEIPTMPKLLNQREQTDTRERWLKARFALLQPMMKRHGVDMWIVVNEEFKSDPIIQQVVPPIPIVGRRDLFIFIDRGDRLERIAMVRYDEERLANHYKIVMPARDKFGEELRKIVDEARPRTIALNYGGTRGQQAGLSHDGYKFLAETLGAETEKKFVSAAPLLTEFLDTRLPEEMSEYQKAVLVTDILTRRAFSNEVITPGKTTVGDVRWWLLEQVNKLGLTVWFQPDLRIQRPQTETNRTGNFLSTAKESDVLQRGDLLHVDFGLNYMGLSTDWQKHAYILKPGESNPPPGLRNALINTTRLQDILFSVARPGMTGSEVYEKTMAEAKKRGLDAMIYSHPIGTQGHGLGPSIDFRGTVGGGGNRILLGSYLSVEMNTSSSIPEWGGQKVTMMSEDDAVMTAEGYRFFRPRQIELYLIK